MNTELIISLVMVSGSLITAAMTFYITKRHGKWAEWQQQKLGHYDRLLSAISDIAIDGKDWEQANQHFASAANTIALVAPQYVITALMAFHDEVKFSNPSRSVERHDELLVELLLAVRRDIGLSKRDDPKTFAFHLIGSAPNRNAKDGMAFQQATFGRGSEVH